MMNSNTVGIAALLRTAAGLAVVVGGSSASAQLAGGGGEGNEDPYANLPAQMVVTGVTRDFRAMDEENGHPDFQMMPYGGSGLYYGCAADELDDEGKPVFASTGFRQTGAWKDAQDRPISPPKDYIDAKVGDTAGSMSQTEGGAESSADAFSQWFRDVPGVNLCENTAITLQRAPGTATYTFDDTLDADYQSLGGFFPINGSLFGNYQLTNKNYHFTFEMETKFVYEPGSGQVFTFSGDDAIWVYVDGKLVIDLGGIHGKMSQTIDMDRLNWLEGGESYTLKLFFAERHTDKSNFRIDTTIPLKNVALQASAGLFD